MFLDVEKLKIDVNLDLLSRTFVEELKSIPTNNYEELIQWYMDLRHSYNYKDRSTVDLYDIEVYPGEGVNWFCAKIWDINSKRVDPTTHQIFANTNNIAKNIPGLVRMHINIVGPNSVVPDHLDTEMNLDSEQHDDTPVYHLLSNVEVGNDGDVYIVNEGTKVLLKQGDLTLMPVDVVHSGANFSSSHWVILAIIIKKSVIDPFYE